MVKTEFFDESDSGKISAGSTTILTGVNSVGVDGLVDRLLLFQAKDEIEVSLIKWITQRRWI